MVKSGIHCLVLGKVTHSASKQAFCFHLSSTHFVKSLEAAVFSPNQTCLCSKPVYLERGFSNILNKVFLTIISILFQDIFSYSKCLHFV